MLQKQVMSSHKRHKRISSATRKLLAQGESGRADFKAKPEGVSADDLVSFANTETGGTILAGIKETPGKNGEQIGVVCGCDIGDATILQIQNKALNCVPPVAIDIHIENLADMPFLRIEVPPSQTKPHCTPRGVYCRRDGVRNRPLHPTELLELFLESEARLFAEKFEAADARIKEDLNELEASLEQSISSMGNQLGWAEFKLDDTENTLNSIMAYAQQTKFETDHISERLRELFKQDKRSDPVRERVRKDLLNKVVKQLSDDPQLYEHLLRVKSAQVNTSGTEAKELSEEDLAEVMREAISIVQTGSDGSDTERT